ncbi:oocyte zinc finger protein XlCOF8.4-like isoform X2 [Hyla sarda]|nr:oocyte zinc finger protein XlCOF8.4-like isoform X2 [Hyla sarda]XP_056378459.1 oocyte zinc finger protein XlCOF8.4-like isoform X2 [Hyla sarda]XP_056378460.1 oocyte zinc finger protein XlCOF8.4-like isoform X2 [Hyla sarda]
MKGTFTSHPMKMDKKRKELTESIFNITIEILYLLTGEDYTLMKKMSNDHMSPIMQPPPQALIHERHNDRKILRLTQKMMELLTGEVPIRCEDVSVYFTMEEWEYLEEHNDLYEYIIMENQQTLMSPDGIGKRNPSGRCSIRPSSQDCVARNLDFREADQEAESDFTATAEASVMVEPKLEEREIPVDKILENECTEGSEEPLVLSIGCQIEDNNKTQDTPEEHPYNTNWASVLHNRDVLSGHPYCDETSDQSKMATQSLGLRDGRVFPCSVCGKHFIQESDLIIHEHSHSGEKPSTGSQYLECFPSKTKLWVPEIIHTGTKPYSCSECGKCFSKKANLLIHGRSHTGEKPFSCSKCGKCFSQKFKLVVHERRHTGEKPFSCPECGKCFTSKSVLVQHERIHTGEKPFSCPECGKCFTRKSVLIVHERSHTGEKPFLCTECGKCFITKAILNEHQRIHTGEKPFSCLACGKNFTQKSKLNLHQKVHPCAT